MDPLNNYIVAFLIAQLCIGWKTLTLAYAVTFAILTFILNYYPQSVNGMMGQVYILLFCLYLVFGLTARLLTLLFAPLKEKPLRFAGITLAGFASGFAIYASLV